ncbi:uncharacterized protein [Amphiura filiformis]|uniref:uncharacterized protein n=1 Tax=Amphiura filiformis TaxID=82378 RepID=UPI003B21A657
MDHYTPPRMSSFLLPRASSCSPSGSSDHSSSSAISSVEQLRSDPESLVTQDIKPTPEMLHVSSLHDNINMVPSPLSMGDRDVQQMPIIPRFDPAQLNEYYMQQFATKLEGGIYAMPMANFGGFTTTMCHPQPSSPSAKGKNGKPDKMFICQECGAVFKHRHHVVRHMRSHSGERPFRCEECGATFARKCILTNHKRTHTGEKPFICTECGDTFSRKHHLVIHRRTHTGEKPYRCGQCGAAFARSHHLNRHRKTHVKIDTLDYPQFPAGLPLHHMQGLPTMLPILSPSLFPKTSSASAEMHADAFKDKVPHRQQELQEHIQGDIGETSKSESEEPSSCSNNVEVSNSFGAKDPASKN